MEKDDNLSIRRQERYRHVFISLRTMICGEWKGIKALDWNEAGFNFFADDETTDPHMMFKKGAYQFSGEIVWRRRNDDDAIILEMLLNTFLSEQLKKLGDNSDSIKRVIKLIRSGGKVEEKKKLLTLLGVSAVSEDNMKIMIDKHKREHPLYRNGVRVCSESWSEIIRHTLEITSGLIILDKIEKDLTIMLKNVGHDEHK